MSDPTLPFPRVLSFPKPTRRSTSVLESQDELHERALAICSRLVRLTNDRPILAQSVLKAFHDTLDRLDRV